MQSTKHSFKAKNERNWIYYYKSLALLSIITTVIFFINPDVIIYWINKYFYLRWEYLQVILQFFIWTFLHWWIMHLLMNLIFLVYFWNIIEEMIWKTKFLLFFIFIVFFSWIAILFLWEGNTIWISWFNLAILSYYSLRLYDLKHPEFKAAMIVLIINIVIWINPNISFLGHFFWALWGLIYYYLLNKNLPFDFEDLYKK